MQKILLLEDEELLAGMYEKKLITAGYEVVWVKTAEEAEQKAEGTSADVIIIDHGIRGYERTGLDIIPTLRKALPKAKIIMLSNYSRAQLEGNTVHANADDYLLKIDTPPNILTKYLSTILKA